VGSQIKGPMKQDQGGRPMKQSLKMRRILTTSHRSVVDIVEEMDRRRENCRIDRIKERQIRENWKQLREKGFGSSRAGRTPVILDYEDGRMLYDILPDNSWKGQRCFIIGGGESLKDFDFSKLKNELVIGVNRAYEVIDCTINYAMDNNIYHWITNGKLGKKARKRFEDFKGIPVWLDSAGYDYPKGIFILNKLGNQKNNYIMKEGLKRGTNAGFGALNLAVCLGANPIYLLGFDMEGRDGKQVWWHDGYPENQVEKIYDIFMPGFKEIAPELKKKGIRVINLNPRSRLKCFEFGEFENVKPIKRPVIVSYYTKGTGYEEQVKYLKVTLKRFNLENDVVGILDRGSWHKNTYYKPLFIQRMMNKHLGRSILYIDADAKMRMNPVLFNDFNYDFACYFHAQREELLSGTLYFGDTKKARHLVNMWIKEDKLHPGTGMPQKNLRAVFDREKDNLKWKKLPVEYCMIYDSRSRYKVNPIVEHFQLSRKYKGSKSRKSIYLTNQSLVEIREFCKNKKICILGNANSVLNEKKNIDSFDVVGRMNRGAPQGKERFIGNRTDILFLSTHMSGENIRKLFNSRFVVWMTACNRLASSWTLKNAIQNPPDDWDALYDKLSINPTTGMMSLNFLLKHIDFKSLTIYGFDFFHTKTWYNTKIDSGQKHSGEREKTLFMKMIKDRSNVRFI